MTSLLSRRAVIVGGGCLCCAGLSPPASARISPAAMTPLIGPGYRPQEVDEKGLWLQYERIEQDIAGSNLLINDPKLTSYLRDLVGKVGGPAARDLRIYLAHVPEFNAFMAPTGFMVVFSGLLTRMRNEAQLAGVIAHEAGHFLRKHQLRAWRDTRTKTDAFTLLGMGLGGLSAAGGGFSGMGDLYQLAQFGTIFSLTQYSRDLEKEADAAGLRLISQAGYAPVEMSNTWAQLIAESEASAAMRRKRPHRGTSLLASHPAPADRMVDLKASAIEVQVAGRTYDAGRDRYLSAIAPHRQMLLDDQVKLNDPGASLYVIHTLAQDGWTGTLRHYEAEVWRLKGKPEDLARAAQGYAAAVQMPDAPAESWRAHGYDLLKAGETEPGKRALGRYLAMKPGASDAAMVRYALAQ